MKYNKSEVMKRAWEMYKASKCYPLDNTHTYKGVIYVARNTPFAFFLHMAWFSAKQEAERAEEHAKRVENKTVFTGRETYKNGWNSADFCLWENYGKRRIYINGGRKLSGYIDLNADNKIVGNAAAKELAESFLETHIVA